MTNPAMLIQELAASRTKTRFKHLPGRRSGSHYRIHIILAVGGILMAFPFIWQIIMSLSTNVEVQGVVPTFWPAHFQWHNYAEVFTRLPFLSQVRTSLLITLIRTFAQIVLCTLAGYAFARMRFVGRSTLLAVVLSILLIPAQVYLISQYQIVQGLGWLNTIMGLVAPGLFSAFGTFLMRTAFLNMPPELEEAARMDGANPFQTYQRACDNHGALVLERVVVASGCFHQLERNAFIRRTGDDRRRCDRQLPCTDGCKSHGDGASADPLHRTSASRH